jgi:regulatory protein
MPVITRIQRQQRGARYSIFIDASYRFSLSENQLLELGLAVGDELEAGRIEELSERSTEGKALDRAYNYLSYRPRSLKEMRDYLRNKDYDAAVIDTVVQRLVDQDVLNDERFAAEWVADRRLLQAKSATALKVELRQKGISSDIVAGVMEAIGPEEEIEAILQLVQRRRLQQKYGDEQKLMQYLAGKGFSFSTIKAALERL